MISTLGRRSFHKFLEKSLPAPLRSLESHSLLLHQRAGDHLQNILVLESVSCMSYSTETRKTNR